MFKKQGNKMRWVADYKLLYDHTTEHCEHQWLAVFATAPALQAALKLIKSV